MKRGDVYRVALDPVVGSEIGKTRLAVVLQNDLANETAPTITVLPISSSLRRVFPFQVRLRSGEGGLEREGKVLCEQVRTISRERVIQRLGRLSPQRLEQVREALDRHLWF